MALQQAKIFFVTSVKGGTGKTTTVLNLAGIFKEMEKRVLIMDFDLYTGSVAASLNIEPTADLFTLVDDLNNNRFDNLNDYVTPFMENIDVIASPKDPRTAGKINSKYLQIVLSKAKLKYDIILIDSSPVLNDINLVTMDVSDEILYLITNDPMDLKNMRTMVSIYRDMGRNNYKIILNDSVDKRGNYFTKYDMKNIINDNIDYTIPSSFYIKNIDKYVMDGKILTLEKGVMRLHKKGFDNLKKIANALLKERGRN